MNLNIKHNDTTLVDIQSGKVNLNTTNKYCIDNLVFTLSDVEFYDGSFDTNWDTYPVSDTEMSNLGFLWGYEE